MGRGQGIDAAFPEALRQQGRGRGRDGERVHVGAGRVKTVGGRCCCGDGGGGR